MRQLGLVLSIGMIAMLKFRDVISLSERSFLRSVLAFESLQASSEYSTGFLAYGYGFVPRDADSGEEEYVQMVYQNGRARSMQEDLRGIQVCKGRRGSF